MKTILKSAALSICAFSVQADTAGLKITEVFMPHHEAATRVALWYPSTADDAPTQYASNPVFEGVEAYVDAPVSPGKHPIVLFSHGMGGTDRAQAWLGAALAERGAVAVMVNHPNTTWGSFDLSEGAKHWTRAQDMSAAFDAVMEMPELADSLDMSRVMAAGFSYGGWTALSLGGARGNHSGIVDACTNHPEMEACAQLMSAEVNIQGIDPAIWNKSHADPRVTHVAAIDPGFVWGLEQPDVVDLVPSVLMIGFGGSDDRMLATDFDRSGLADLLGEIKTEQFEPAYHFSAMPICTPAGEAILAEENDDPVCTDPTGSDRMAIHTAIIDLLAAELGL